MTLGIYTHLEDEKRKEAAVKINEYFSNRGQNGVKDKNKASN